MALASEINCALPRLPREPDSSSLVLSHIKKIFLLISGEVEIDRLSVALDSTRRTSARNEVQKQFLRSYIENVHEIISVSRITEI